MVIHKTLAEGRWFTLTLAEQLANIGSEVERAISWHKKGDKEQSDKAVERALELVDLTIEDKRWKGRLKEILRMREILCDTFFGDNIYDTSFEFLQKYFLYFGILARAGR
ncbi:MAG: hypothetical protein AB1546_08985 [bacterium]